MSEADQHPETGTVGERLRAAREAAGLSLADIAATTRVNIRHLTAIESGERALLPAAPYSTGFVKAYARAVGLDSAGMSADFRREFDLTRFSAVEAVRYEPSDPSRLPSRMLAWTAAAVALLILVGYAVWRSGSVTGDGAEDRARVAAAVEPPAAPLAPAATAPAIPVPVAAPAPAPAPAGGPVLLTAREAAWIKVYERDGTTLFQGELAPGRSYEVPADARDPLIRLGRSEALTVSVGGRAVAPLGPPARTVKDVSLKADALLARPVAAAALL